MIKRKTQQKNYGLWHINSVPPDYDEKMDAMWWFDENIYEDNPECFPNGPNSVIKTLKNTGVLNEIVSCEQDRDTLVVNFEDLSQGCLFIIKLNHYLKFARKTI